MVDNKAIYLRYQGFIDTDVSFSTFFDSAHTIMAWFMPEYPYSYAGPIVAENGTGNYAFGQGDYRWGNGGFKQLGDPVLFLKIGNSNSIYLAPEVKPKEWYHIAVCRRFQPNKGSSIFELYLNGIHKTPVKIDKSTQPPTVTLASEIEIPISGSLQSKPSGTLRFGRRTSGNENSMRRWQAYGLLDDVALFDTALEPNQIANIVNQGRLNGHENELTLAGLIAGWCFDTESSEGILNTAWQPSEERHKGSVGPDVFEIRTMIQTPVSSNRDNDSDKEQIENLNQAFPCSAKMRLPIPYNSVWRVIQGYDNPSVSHNGYASFCFDIVLAKPDADKNNYPEGTDYAPVANCYQGYLLNFQPNGPDATNPDRESNYVRIRLSNDEFVTYLHLAKNSLPPNFIGTPVFDENGNVTYYQVPDDQPIFVDKDTIIGKIGPKASHLHFGGGGFEAVTHPVTFTNYYVSNNQGVNWEFVQSGYPKEGQSIKILKRKKFKPKPKKTKPKKPKHPKEKQKNKSKPKKTKRKQKRSK